MLQGPKSQSPDLAYRLYDSAQPKLGLNAREVRISSTLTPWHGWCSMNPSILQAIPWKCNERRLRVTQPPTPPAFAQPRNGNIAVRFWEWLPLAPNRAVRVLAWLSVVLQLVLIGTGGAVRLTASGLGCPTWPQCQAGSFVPTPELGYHGVIEFTNRMLTFVLSVVVILVFVAVLRMRKQRRDLFVLTLLQGLSIPLQAVIGGISVLTGLNPYVVGLHFVISMLLVVLTTMLVWRVYRGQRAPRWAPVWFTAVAWVTVAFVAATVVFGILTTGSGPHAGDALTAKALSPRNGLNSSVIQDIHSIPAYITFALTLVLFAAAWIAKDKPRWKTLRRATAGLLAIELVQIIVGITQAREGLPIALVNIHLVLAGILVALMTAVVLGLRGRVAQQQAG
jgi:cytochrome c oxidase assembly protein subunit 15